METNQCVYCKKTFSNKYNLANHTKRTKSCLEIQRKLNVEVVEELTPCEYCLVKYNPAKITRHQLSCKGKKQYDYKTLEETIKSKEAEIQCLKDFIVAQGKMYEDKIKNLHSEVSKLEGQNDILRDDHECFKEIAKQAKVTNNNKILNMPSFNLSAEKIANEFNTKYTYKHGLLGQEGVAEFVRENLLVDEDGKPNYACTDISRHIFKYVDDKREVRKDPKATELTKMIVDANIKQINRSVCHNWCLDENGSVDKSRENYAFDKVMEVEKLASNNSAFVKKLSEITAL